jgi:hypothetical protein
MKIRTMLVGAVAMSVVQFAGTAVHAHSQSPKFKEIVEVSGRTHQGLGGLTVAFSGPVSLPGVSLAAGRYIFKQPANNIVQVADLNGQPYRMFITIPTVRQTAEEGYSFVLGPGLHADSPRRLLAMFAPGETIGQQFVYPAAR